jgi:hypothetical protein
VANLIIYFMPPVMYTRRCSADDAARAIVRLILDDPVPFILFILFMIALWIGWIMVGCLVTCLTCCLASLPYIGTVIVLPVPVFFRSFSLLFLRQFGPDWMCGAKSRFPSRLLHRLCRRSSRLRRRHQSRQCKKLLRRRQ